MYRSYKQCVVMVVALLSLTACKPKKAIDFKDAIDQQERTAFNILVATDGAENKKLEYLIKRHYDSALAMIDEQETEFNRLINNLEALPTGSIKEAATLKEASINYYTTLKELQLFDRLNIANWKLSMQSKGEELDKVNNKSLELSLQKQDLFKKVHEKEALLDEARKKFNAANGTE